MEMFSDIRAHVRHGGNFLFSSTTYGERSFNIFILHYFQTCYTFKGVFKKLDILR